MTDLPSLFSPSRLVLLCAAATFTSTLWATPASSSPPRKAAASAPAGGANVPLRDTPWALQTLGGAPVIAGAQPVQIKLRSNPQHLSGFAGCNSLRGRYTQRGTTLALKPIATTRMACSPELMQQESTLLQAMANADSYRVEGRQLSLLQADAVTATFTVGKKH